jgi:cation transport protein ChaC
MSGNDRPPRPQFSAPGATGVPDEALPPRWTEQQLQTSLASALAHWNGRTPLWVFGYGSLIWKPEFAFDARQPARIHGYHRRLCLRSVMYRGTKECPGIVFGLDRGGSCLGMAYEIGARQVPVVFRQLWEREMMLGSYRPTWLAARLRRGRLIEALAFVVRRDAFNYCGVLDEQAIVAILATACGARGTSLEYLQHTVAALHADGLRDLHLERLLHRAGAPPKAHGP